MDPRRREIEQLEGEAARIEQQIAGECVGIGRQIAGLDHRETHSAELSKYLNSVEALRKSEDDFRNDITRIRDTVRKIDELQSAISENDRGARKIAEEREARCVELGAGAYTVFKALSDRERYRPFFEEVLRLEREIEGLENQLKTLDEEEKTKGLFERLRYKGKKIVVRGSINKIEKQKMKAYGEAGAKVIDSDFAARTSGDLRQLFDFAAERKKAHDGLSRDAQRLREEVQRHQETLKKYGIDDDPDRRCQELEKRIGDVRRELDVMYSWMGQLFIEKDLRSEFADASLAAKYDVVSALRQSIQKKRGQIHRLKAEVEIEELQKKEKSLRQLRKQLEEELKVKERQIAVKDIEISTGQRRIEELKRVISGEVPYSDAPPFPAPPDLYAPKPPEEKPKA